METKIRWKAPEFRYYPKTAGWYYWSIFITLIFLAFTIWQKNFLFGFFIVVAETLIISWSSKKPALLDFALDEKGLTIGAQKSYSYTELKGFAKTDMDQDGSSYTELILYFKPRIRNTLLILVPREKYEEIRAALEEKLPETEAELPLLDALGRIIRF
jgi:hypothetical protein